MKRMRGRTSAGLVLLCAALVGACDDGTDPPRVVEVRIEPASPTVPTGETVQLTARPVDQAGNTVPGLTVSWSSSAQGVATVSDAGLVTGQAAGESTITASAGGRSGTTVVTVQAPADLELTSVSPTTLVPGETATLSGDGFSTTPSSNTVRVNGVLAHVVSANATSLQIRVPCVAAGGASVTVTRNGATSSAVGATVQASDALSLAVGEFTMLRSGFCVELPTQGNSEQYLVGVQSISETPSQLTPVTLAMDVAGSGTVASMAPVAVSTRRAPDLTGISPRALERGARWARHQEAELDLRARELALLKDRFGSARRSMSPNTMSMQTSGATSAAGTIPVDVALNDTVVIRVPDTSTNDICANYNEIRAVVRYLSDEGVFLADVENPAGGFTTSDYQLLGNQLDDRILATLTDYFGEVTDIDANGRIAVVITRRVNARDNVLGFVAAGDLFDRAGTNGCASSDEGELYYGRAPDPNGDAGQAYSVEDARLDAAALLAHELTHIIQFGRRLQYPNAETFPTVWELESQATLAEEVVGHDFTGRQPRQNYGFQVAFNRNAEASPIDWYSNKFADLAVYYGFRSQTEKAAGAPEQCTFLGRPPEGETWGPCIQGRMPYTGWSFLRWLSDHYGPAMGGEQQLHRRLIDNRFDGFTTIEEVIGEPIDELLTRWAAMLYIDDRVGGATPLITLPSWDLVDIEQGLVSTARLEPYVRGWNDFSDNVSLRAGSAAYFRIGGGSRAASAIRATAQSSAGAPASSVRMWVVRMQ